MKYEDKPILIILEGVDKSGKTTLLNSFNKATDFKYVVLDRLIASSKVYDEVFERGRTSYYDRVEKALNNAFDVLVVLCESDEVDVRKRLADAKEVLPKQLDDIERIKNMFRKEVFAGFRNKMVLNTSVMSIDECVEAMVERLEGMEKDHGRSYSCV